MGSTRKERPGVSTTGTQPPPLDYFWFHSGEYNLCYNATDPGDRSLEVKARPRAGAFGTPGAAMPLLGPLKLSPKVLVEDSRAVGAYPLISSKLFQVTEKRILSDGGSDYASVKLKLNPAFPNLADFIRNPPETPLQLRITVFVDLSALAGAAAGMALPAGTAAIPVPGNAKIRLHLVEPWKLWFKKFMWKDLNGFELNKLPWADLAGLHDLAQNGGTLIVYPDGVLDLDGEDTKVWTQNSVRDAELRVLPPGAKKDIEGKYDADEDGYRFEIPPPAAVRETPKPASASELIDVNLVDDVQNRLRGIYSRAMDAGKVLESPLEQDAEVFAQKCLDYLGEKTRDHIRSKAKEFGHATYAAAYFVKFSELTAKGFVKALRVHQKAYRRFMENLVAGSMEVLFLLGDMAFDKVIGPYLKSGKDAAAQQLKQESKTLGQTAVEEVEAAIKPKKKAADAAAQTANNEYQKALSEVKGILAKRQDALKTTVEQEVQLAAKKTAKQGAEKELEEVAKSVAALEGQGLPASLQEARQAAAKVGRELESTLETLKVKQADLTKNLDAARQAQMLLIQRKRELADARTEVDAIRQQIARIDNLAKPKPAQMAELNRLEKILGPKEAALEGREAALGPRIESLQKTVSDYEELVESVSRLKDKKLALEPRKAGLDSMADHLARRDSLQGNLKTLDEEIRNLSQKAETGMATYIQQDDAFKRTIDNLAEQELALAEKQARAQALALQEQHLDRFKAVVSNKNATQQEVKAAMDQMTAAMQDTKPLLDFVQAAAEGRGGVETLHKLKLEFTELQANLDVSNATRDVAMRRYEVVEAAIERVRFTEGFWDGILKAYGAWITDTLKDKFNERAKKIKEFFEDLTHSKHKAVPAKVYKDQFAWGWIWAKVDSFLEYLANWWNWLWATAFEAYGDYIRDPNLTMDAQGAWKAFGYLMGFLADSGILILSIFWAAVDAVLTLWMKFLECVIDLFNSPKREISILTDEAKSKTRAPTSPMPGSLPDEFFEFAKDMLGETTKAVDPKNVASHSGGRSSIETSIRSQLSGEYEKYYTPQQRRARDFMLALAGAQNKGALDAHWLESDKVRSDNREATQVLSSILSRMDKFETAFDSEDQGGMAAFECIWTGGDWTSHDLDVIAESLSSYFSTLLKVAAVVVLLGGFVAPGILVAVPGILLASTYSDRIWAALRVAIVMIRTNPRVLAMQFDVMRVYSLAYQSVYQEYDMSEVLEQDSEEVRSAQKNPLYFGTKD